MKLQEFLPRLKKVRKCGGEYEGECPGHEDNRSSLTIAEGEDERILINCHAGCSPEHILEAMGLKLSDLYPPKEQRQVVAEYDYLDIAGKLIHKTVRFEPKGFSQCRPDGMGGWIYNLKGVTTILYNLPKTTEAIKENKTVLIVEGEKDCDSLGKIGIVATTSPMGAGKWKPHYADSLKGASVVIVPDNDEAGKAHAEQVAASLVGKAKSVKIIDLPGLKEKQDVTDFFRANGKSKGMNTLKQLIEATPEYETKDGSSKNDLFFDGKTFVPKRLADKLMQRHHFKFAADMLWVYRDGVYRRDGERVVKSEGQMLLGEASRDNRITETLHYIERATACELPDPDTRVINVRNGLLNWDTLELVPHNPKVFSVVQLPVAYNLSATCPEFTRYSESTFDATIIPLIGEIMGICLIPYTRFEKAIMLKGPGGAGKSVFLDTLEALLGTENTSHVSLQELEEDRFAKAALLGKMANIFADLDDRALKSSIMLKTLTTGDMIRGQRKFGVPFDFRNYAKLLFSANKLPGSRDRTTAFYDRWIIVPFEKTFRNTDSDDKNLRDKLQQQDELNGIFLFALEGLRRLFENGRFTIPNKVSAALEEYERDNDSVASFIAECVEIDRTSTISKQVFYKTYRLWCDDQGMRPVSSKLLKLSLQQVVPYIDEIRPQRGTEPWHWVGIRLNDDAPELAYPLTRNWQ